VDKFYHDAAASFDSSKAICYTSPSLENNNPSKIERNDEGPGFRGRSDRISPVS
jgi:hypothetical protein